MAVFKCKMCGGTLEISENQKTAVCEYCGTEQTLPRLDDDRRANLYDRANHFRRNNEFDKAMGIYEQLLNEDGADAEAYWSLVLCRYGIEYVEDPATHKRMPTVNRVQYTSVFDDEDYKAALANADPLQRSIYEAEAAAINEIQKNILAISQKEDPFDVFICYKETDASGRRTQDSVLANDLYHQLVQEGFKVFFSRITLEDKLGAEYEPYIFAALNSAKVMVVLGTKPEYFNAVWVKNEWSRYLALIRNGAKKTLIPAYRDMDPYDLPEEFSHLQAQDMSKLGFMQDLIRGIKKILEADKPKAETLRETTVIQNEGGGNLTTLLKRGSMALEDSEWDKANGFFEAALNIDAECAQAYFGLALADWEIKDLQESDAWYQDRTTNKNFLRAEKYADVELLRVIENAKSIVQKKEDDEIERQRLIQLADREKKKQAEIAEAIFMAKLLESRETEYVTAISVQEHAKTENQFLNAADLFESLLGYKDSQERATNCREKASELANEWKLLEDARLAEKQKQEELAKKKAILVKDQKMLQDELANLKGLFTNRRRKEIEARLTEIGKELQSL